MNDFWVIGDVAGEFDCLMRLVKKLPENAKLVFVGDLCDRGLKTKEVIEWVKNSGHISLMGNHEHMFIDYIMSKHDVNYKPVYDPFNYCHIRIGGMQTLISYLGEDYNSWLIADENAKEKVLEHVEWLKERPVIFEADGVVVTHAPMKFGDIKIFKASTLDDQVWNRDFITKNDKFFQFFGHNGKYDEYWKKPNLARPYAICVDDSHRDKLTAVHWPSLKMEVEKY